MRIILRATGALALGLVALALVTMGVFSPSSTSAETGVIDPTPGSVFQVAVDMDTTGNDPGTGGANLLSAIDAASALGLGDTQEIDIIVDEVATADGMSGFSFNLKFNPAVIQINTKDFNTFMLPGAFEIIPAPVPNTSGNLRMDPGQIAGNVTGEGVLVRFEIECLADGSSPLDLADDDGGDGIPDILDGVNFGAPLNVENAVDGSIICGAGDPATPTPTPTEPGGTATPTEPGGTATPTATPTPTPTEPGGTATPTEPGGTATSTATSTATPTATPAPTAAPTSAAAGTATPGSLPPTGGSDGSLSLSWTLWLMLAAGLIFTSLGAAVFARSRARTEI